MGNCGECENRWMCNETPDTCGVGAGSPLVTNADRIRAMSDEELSEYFADMGSETNNGTIYSDRPEEWLEWLKQPVKEDEQ